MVCGAPGGLSGTSFHRILRGEDPGIVGLCGGATKISHDLQSWERKVRRCSVQDRAGSDYKQGLEMYYSL